MSLRVGQWVRVYTNALRGAGAMPMLGKVTELFEDPEKGPMVKLGNEVLTMTVPEDYVICTLDTELDRQAPGIVFNIIYLVKHGYAPEAVSDVQRAVYCDKPEAFFLAVQALAEEIALRDCGGQDASRQP